MSQVNELYDMARRALDAATGSGAQEVEVYGLVGRGIHVDIQVDKIDLARETYTRGLGIKAVVNGAIGFSSTNQPDSVLDAARAAVRAARVRDSDPDWSGLPASAAYQKVRGLYDPGIAGIDIESCIDLSARMMEGAVSLEGATPTSGKFTCSNSVYIILNSNGVEVQEETTRMDGFMECRAGEGSEMANAFEFEVSRNLDIDFYEIGRQAARKAIASVGGVGAPSGEMDVLLKPDAIADLLESTFLVSLSAENVQKGRSALAGKLGSQLGAEALDITDDGLLEGGIGSGASDDEGTPSRTNKILEQGVLGTYLYDSYTAGKDGVESTGNAVRNSYTQTTSIDVRNLKLEYPVSDVLAETQRGVMVGSVIGAHTANPISGDFSVEARNSFVIEDGEVGGPIRSMMLSGNIFQLLRSITGAGRDMKVLGKIITPTVRVSGLKVIG